MKNLLLTAFAAVLLLSACKTEKKDTLNTDKQIVFTDTTLLKPTDGSSDVGVQGNKTPAAVPVVKEAPPKPEVRTITKYVTVKEKPAPKPKVINTPPVIAPVPAPVATAPTTGNGTNGTGTTTGTNNGTGVPAKKKGGWSDAAKDATIGGVGGAVLGGVIGKGAKGAVIGGVLGGVGGYILGRKKDKSAAAKIDTTRY